MNKIEAIVGGVAVLTLGGLILWGVGNSHMPVSADNTERSYAGDLTSNEATSAPSLTDGNMHKEEVAVTSSKPIVTTNQATGVTSTGAILQGVVNPNLAETLCWFEYSTEQLTQGTLFKVTSQQPCGTEGIPLSVARSVSSLQPKTSYYFRAVARSNIDTVRGVVESFKTK